MQNVYYDVLFVAVFCGVAKLVEISIVNSDENVGEFGESRIHRRLQQEQSVEDQLPKV